MLRRTLDRLGRSRRSTVLPERPDGEAALDIWLKRHKCWMGGIVEFIWAWKCEIPH